MFHYLYRVFSFISLVHSKYAAFGNVLRHSFPFQAHKGIPVMTLDDGLLGALGGKGLPVMTLVDGLLGTLGRPVGW